MPIIAKQRDDFARVPRPPRTIFRTRDFVRARLQPALAAAVAAFLFSACGSRAGAEPDWDIELPFSQVDTVAAVGDAVFCLGSDADLSYGYAPCRIVIVAAATGVERFHTILDLRALRNVDDFSTGKFALVEGTTAVVISQSGRMRAFEATSGRELWAIDNIEVVLGSGGGYVFASDGDSNLAAFDVRSGSRAALDADKSWRNEITPTSVAAGSTDRAYVATGASVCAVDVPSGHERWVQPFESIRSDVQVVDGCVIATSRNGWHVFDADTGALLWRFEAYETSRPTPPTIAGDMLFTMRGRASNQEVEEGYLRVYDLRTGELKTRFARVSLPGTDTLVASRLRLFLPIAEPHYGWFRKPLVESTGGEDLANSSDCRPSAIDAATGRTVWTGEPASWGSLTPPSISDAGVVAIAAMTPKRNKPARLRAYRPVYSE